MTPTRTRSRLLRLLTIALGTAPLVTCFMATRALVGPEAHAVIARGPGRAPDSSTDIDSISPAFSQSEKEWQDQDEDVIRVNTDLVVLNATVLDHDGKFINGLKRT